MPGIGIVEESWKALTSMGMRDGPAQCSPQPFDAVGFRIVRRRVDQYQLTPQFLQEYSQEQRALRGMEAQVVEQHQHNPSTRLGALDGSAELGTEGGAPPTRCSLPIEPAVAPVDQAEAVLLAVVPWWFH